MSGGYAPLGASGYPPPPSTGDMVEVVLPSGAAFPVHAKEVEYLTDLARRYTADNHFSNIADLQDVDRLLILELMCFRWGVWISRGSDYDGNLIDPDAVQQSLKGHSAEVRQIKGALDVTKRARDKAKGEDSVSHYILTLLGRAKEFGVHREMQSAKAIELFMEMRAMVQLYVNCDQQEREEMHVEAEDVLEWIVTVATPEFEALDRHFRANQQRYWVRDI